MLRHRCRVDRTTKTHDAVRFVRRSRNPPTRRDVAMGFASLYPSYALRVLKEPRQPSVRLSVIFAGIHAIKRLEEARIHSFDPIHRTLNVIVISVNALQPKPKRANRKTNCWRHETDIGRGIIGKSSERPALGANQPPIQRLISP